VADPEEDYYRRLEDEYDQPRRIRRFFARPRRAPLFRSLGGGASVSIALAAGQGSPVNAGPINFTVTFSEAATGFTNADVSFTGTTTGGTPAAAVTGTGPAYNVAVTGMTGNGVVSINIPAASATTAKAVPFPASNTATVVFDTARPSVTVAAAAGQPDPAALPPITFTVTFSEPVTGFVAADVVITGTAGGTKSVSLNGFNAEVTGMTTGGTVIATVPVNAVTDLAGNLSTVSNSASVTWTPDTIAPTVTINKGASQADPTSASPILFDIVFSEVVTGFINTDVTVTFAGTGTPAVSLSGTGPTYTASVTGMGTDGNVTASIAAGVCTDLSGNANLISTSTDNIVAWVKPAAPVGLKAPLGMGLLLN
jgi:Bacterial Ig-like domain